MTNHVLKLPYFAASVFIMLLSSFHGSGSAPEGPSPAYEKILRDKFDSHAVFKWSEYARLLEKLCEEKFVVLPLNEMRKAEDASKVIVGLRHDVDLNPFKALEMAKIENIFGIRSTFYFLATAEYSGKFKDGIFYRSPEISYILQEVSKTGSEIGIHNDLLAIMIEHGIDPLEFNRQELKYYGSLNIGIAGTASHGSTIAKKTVPNYNIFSDFKVSDSVEYHGKKYQLGKHSMTDFGFQYEAYKIPFGKYYSESGGRWNDPEGIEGILKKLDACKAGERVQILVHPDWWGMK